MTSIVYTIIACVQVNPISFATSLERDYDCINIIEGSLWDTLAPMY